MKVKKFSGRLRYWFFQRVNDGNSRQQEIMEVFVVNEELWVLEQWRMGVAIAVGVDDYEKELKKFPPEAFTDE